jgi:hypothetical protein
MHFHMEPGWYVLGPFWIAVFGYGAYSLWKRTR